MKLFLCALGALLLIAATARAVPVTVRVADANGQPIASATVSYLDYANWQIGEPKSRALETARTTPDGTLALDLKGAKSSFDEDGFYSRNAPNSALGAARVSAPGYGARNVLLIVGENSVKLGAATQLSGVVRDENGAAVAGTRVELAKVEKIPYGYDDERARAGFEPVVATTGSDGKWKFEDLARGYATLLVSAPAKVTAELQATLDAPNVIAPSLQLQNAGTVKGRVTDANGRALPDISVSFFGRDGAWSEGVESDGEGNFVLPGVPLGESKLSFWPERGVTWLGVDDEVKVTVARAGATVDVGEVRAGNGILVSGRLKLENGEPLENFAFLIGQTKFRTDATGRFEGRVEKYSSFANLPDGYVMVTKSPNIAPEPRTLDVGEILVGRATTLPLDVRDEAGRAVPQATLSFDSETRGNTTYFGGSPYFDGQNVSSGPLLPGDYTLNGQHLWEVSEPKTVRIALPQAGEQPAPLRVVVRKLKPTRASGRVVDERGGGVAGAPISVSLGYGSVTVNSRADGTWEIEFDARGEPSPLRAVELQGYKFVRGGEWTQQNDDEFDSWRAADIVMARTDIALAGRVVDDNGDGVAGARVSWGDEPIFQSVAADAQGNFKIEGLPAAPITLAASDGQSYAHTAATPGEPVEITLPPAATKLADAQLEKLWETASAGEVPRLWPYFDILGAPRIFEATKRFDAQRDPTEIGGLYNYLDILAQRAITPAQREAAAAQGVALLRRFPIAQTSGLGAARIALLAARSDDAEVRAWAETWYDAQKKNQSLDRTHPYYAGETLRVATVGALLGRADASDYLSIGLTLADRFPGEEKTYYFSGWGAIVAQGDAQWFEEAVSGWAPLAQMGAIAGALKTADDVTRARELLARLETLADSPTVVASEAQEKAQHPDYETTRARQLAAGRSNFARATATFDASAALEELERHTDNPAAAAATFAVARAAIAQGQTEVARRALRLGLRDFYQGAPGAGALALLARDFDPELARELLDYAHDRVLPAENRSDGPLDIAFYAFALRDFDAGAGRLLLEQQWALQHAVPTPPGYNWGRTSDLQNLAWAMSAYDLTRALQWLDSIQDQRADAAERADQTRVAIMAAALATPQQRPLALAIRAYGEIG